MKPFIVATVLAFLLSLVLFTMAGPDVEMPWEAGISGIVGAPTGVARDDRMVGNMVIKDQPRNAVFLKEIQNSGVQNPAEFPLGGAN